MRMNHERSTYLVVLILIFHIVDACICRFHKPSTIDAKMVKKSSTLRLFRKMQIINDYSMGQADLLSRDVKIQKWVKN